MIDGPRQISLDQWSRRYFALRAAGLREAAYGGPLERHLADGDRRLAKLRLDNSAAALRLWNFLLTEEDRLHAARAAGQTIVAAMKDLGTVPVMAFSLPEVTAFYPDGAWWLPCMEMSAALLHKADELGVDESFCPVRAMLGAFAAGTHFPRPDLMTCSVGATCDDFSAIAQRLEKMGFPIVWWEVPHRRAPEPGEPAMPLPGGLTAPASQVRFVAEELARVRRSLEQQTGRQLTDDQLAVGITEANRIRRRLSELRMLVYRSAVCPLGSLEMLIAEMLAIHFCSDRGECLTVLEDLLEEVRRRVRAGQGVLPGDAVRVFWVNPVADLWVMNLLEACGGRVCGSDYMFSHALDAIPEDAPPLEALACAALADLMTGPAADRARRIVADAEGFAAEAVVISRIPGASHCAMEGRIISDMIGQATGLPVLEVEVPPVADAMAANLRTRLEALVESARRRRG